MNERKFLIKNQLEDIYNILEKKKNSLSKNYSVGGKSLEQYAFEEGMERILTEFRKIIEE